jgi:hypothetical protein
MFERCVAVWVFVVTNDSYCISNSLLPDGQFNRRCSLHMFRVRVGALALFVKNRIDDDKVMCPASGYVAISSGSYDHPLYSVRYFDHLRSF